jgi:hypothetical protein
MLSVVAINCLNGQILKDDDSLKSLTRCLCNECPGCFYCCRLLIAIQSTGQVTPTRPGGVLDEVVNESLSVVRALLSELLPLTPWHIKNSSHFIFNCGDHLGDVVTSQGGL